MNELEPNETSGPQTPLDTFRIALRAALVTFVAIGIWSLGEPLGWQIPLGMDVVRGPIPAPMEGALWKAAALVFIGVTLLDKRIDMRLGSLGPRSMATALVSVCTVVCLFGLLFGSDVLMHFPLVAVILVLGWELFRSAHKESAKQTALPAPDYAATPAMYIGLFLSGLGVAIALQGLDARLALWGYGEPSEANLRKAVFLAIAAFGGLAFSGVLGKPLLRRLALIGAPLYVPATCVVSLALLAPLTGHGGLDIFLRSFGSDLSAIGSIKGTALIAARGLFLPAIAVGVLLSATGRKATLLPLLLGAALGVAALPLIPTNLHLGSSHETAYARGMELCMVGALACLAGWLAMAFAATPNPTLRRRIFPLLVIAPLLGVPLGYDAPLIRPLSPWLNFEATPVFIEDTPLGLLTVESTRNGSMVLTLDRYRMTPDIDIEASDREQLLASLDFIATNTKSSNPVIRVLLAGQITIGRWDTFHAWKAERGVEATLDWTVPWEDSVNQIRPHFEFPDYLKDPISQAEARKRLDAGSIDLVVTLATYGPEITALSAEAPPMAPGRIAGSGGTAGDAISIVWLDSRTPLATAEVGTRALLAGSNLDHMAVGLIASQDEFLDHGSSRVIPKPQAGAPSGVYRLSTRPELRAFTDRAGLFARLTANENDDREDSLNFLSALSDLLALQLESSPWDAADVRFEIEREHLQALLEATGPSLTRFQRSIWDHLALILTAKRLPEEAYAIFPSLLQQTEGSWPQVEYALARAYQEFLMPQEAAVLLGNLFDAGHLNLIPLLEYATCEGQLGNWPRAAEVLAQAFLRAPENHGIERHLAIAEMQAGLPTGPARIRAVIDKDPEDEHNKELEAYLQAGPMPAAPSGFNPTPLNDHDDH